MLGKLLKYEFKATMRIFIPIYIALMAVALVNRIFRMGGIRFGYGISTTILVVLFMTLGVITLVMIVQQFEKNLLGDEGYLMFTLPVKTESLMFSKIIISIVWMILSGIVAGITGFILVGTFEGLKDIISNWDVIWAEISSISINGREVTVNPLFVIGSLGITAILIYASNVLQIYLALAIAQLPKLSKHRRIVAFASFIIINIVVSILTGKLANTIPAHAFNNFIGGMFTINGYIFIVCAALFGATKYLLDHHLNLE